MEHRKQFFISYDRDDYIDNEHNIIHHSIVNKVLEALNNAQLDYFIDLEGISGTEQFARVIPEQILNSEAVIFILTENSATSSFVYKEINYAVAKDKKVFVIKDIDEIPQVYEFLLTTNEQYYDYRKNAKIALFNLIADLKIIIGEELDRLGKELDRLDQEKIAAKVKKDLCISNIGRQKEYIEKLEEQIKTLKERCDICKLTLQLFEDELEKINKTIDFKSKEHDAVNKKYHEVLIMTTSKKQGQVNQDTEEQEKPNIQDEESIKSNNEVPKQDQIENINQNTEEVEEEISPKVEESGQSNNETIEPEEIKDFSGAGFSSMMKYFNTNI